MADNYPVGIAWLLVMFYIMMFCQHHICEAYFVPALNVLMDKMGGSKNPWLQRLGNPGVAGATFMALGANGPELFTNLFALFQHSDGGIGVVIGSEIFNLLVIIGASICSTPTLPLTLEKVPFARDVMFYALSIALLVWAMADYNIQYSEACIMLAAGGVYWAAVYFTEDVANRLFGKPEEVAATANKQAAKVHGVAVEVKEIYHSRMADAHGGGEGTALEMEATSAGVYAVAKEGPAKTGTRASVGFSVGDGNSLLGGGLMMYKDLKEVTVQGEGLIEMHFQRSSIEAVTLQVTCASSADRDQLLENLKENSLGRTWVHAYDPTPVSSFKHLFHHLKHEGCMGKIHGVLEFFVDFALRLTLFWCDVKDIKKEGMWIPLFVCSMLWLAFFSYAMVAVMGLISANISFLSPMLLGVTLGAIGTSLPNAMGSIIMSKQGKSAASIGNAFGSNVQNVFLAMAGPWIIYLSATSDVNPDGSPVTTVYMPPPTKGQSVSEGISWMIFTLILVVFFALLPATCTFNKTAGYIFLSVYAAYLAWTVYEFES